MWHIENDLNDPFFDSVKQVNSFLKAAESFGLPSEKLFAANDLVEGENIPKVINSLLTLGRLVSFKDQSSLYFCENLHFSLNNLILVLRKGLGRSSIGYVQLNLLKSEKILRHLSSFPSY